jgi:hypothetical protein
VKLATKNTAVIPALCAGEKPSQNTVKAHETHRPIAEFTSASIASFILRHPL